MLVDAHNSQNDRFEVKAVLDDLVSTVTVMWEGYETCHIRASAMRPSLLRDPSLNHIEAVFEKIRETTKAYLSETELSAYFKNMKKSINRGICHGTTHALITSGLPASPTFANKKILEEVRFNSVLLQVIHIFEVKLGRKKFSFKQLWKVLDSYAPWKSIVIAIGILIKNKIFSLIPCTRHRAQRAERIVMDILKDVRHDVHKVRTGEKPNDYSERIKKFDSLTQPYIDLSEKIFRLEHAIKAVKAANVTE